MNRVADHHHGLSGTCQLLELRAGSLAGPIVEPVAQLRLRKQLRHAEPAADAPVERGPGDGAETEAVVRAGRNHDAIEWRQQVGLGVHIGPESERHALVGAGRRHVGDVALKAPLARLDLLEQRRLAGIAKRPSWLFAFLEHRHGVAVGDQRGVGQARRSGADHRDALAARRARCREHRFAAGGAIDHAADARTAAHFVDAGVAGEAAPDRLAAGELVDPLRIGDQCPTERDEVGLTVLDRGGGDRRIAEPADRDHRDVDQRLDLAGKVEKRRVRHFHGREHDLRRRPRAIMSGGDMQRVGAGVRRPQRDLLAFVEWQPAVEEILDRQPVDHAEAGDCGFHRAQDVEPEARPVLETAAVLVGALVFERCVKL